MTCACSKYLPIELDRKSIARRIKESMTLRRGLIQVAERNGLRLMQCPTCAQMWQSGREWNFANAEYIFQVPPTETVEWLKEQYVQPAALMVYSALMRDYWAKLDATAGALSCKRTDCGKKAIRNSTLCAAHHIASLQEMQVLPREPSGRLFPPYHVENAA